MFWRRNMKYRDTINQLNQDLYLIEEKYLIIESKDEKGLRSVRYKSDDNANVTKMDFLPSEILKRIAKEKNNDVKESQDDLNEKKRRNKKRTGNPDYYKGTRKSNKSMEREINKCAKEPRPESCYDYWDADKKYDKSKNEALNEIKNLIEEIKELEEANLSSKTRETLKKKAEKANMPLGALTSVYRKGLAAWLTGHRQGIPQHQWAMARVNSFISGGKTRSVDKAEWKKVQKHRGKK
jgi:hypothetical protein